MKPARDAMKKVVSERMKQFGQAGHAKDYAPIPLSEMTKRYTKEPVAV
jgi:fructose-bisphosphate aldolase class II